jgi:hypothetical protein
MLKEVATYLHPETVAGSRPQEAVSFFGHSVPHFARVRAALAERLGVCPQLPLRQAALADYRTVHTPEYLEQVATLAGGEPPKTPPRLSPECRGLWHFLPAYLYGLGGLCEAIDQMVAGRVARAYCFSLPGHHASSSPIPEVAGAEHSPRHRSTPAETLRAGPASCLPRTPPRPTPTVSSPRSRPGWTPWPLTWPGSRRREDRPHNRPELLVGHQIVLRERLEGGIVSLGGGRT